MTADRAGAPTIGDQVTFPDARRLDGPWEAAWLPAGDRSEERDELPPDGLSWLQASVPGTAAAVLASAGRVGEIDLDETDWWFRTSFDAARPPAGEEVRLRIGGVATLATIFLNGRRIAASADDWTETALDVGPLLAGRNELVIACRALGPELRRQRSPRARWRSRLVDDNALRWQRTTLLGRAPGFAPGPPRVGPWRPVTLERRAGLAIDDVRLRARVDDAGAGVLSVTARLRPLDATRIRSATLELDGPNGRFEAALRLDGERVEGRLTIPSVARWWPHTHGDPSLHAVALRIDPEGPAGGTTRPIGRVGFRALAAGGRGHRVDVDGLDLRINGVPIFARGAVWTPLGDDGAALRAVLERARAAGMNLLRIPGFAGYESEGFLDLCDELGILLWQDLAFANLDYPFADAGFHTLASAEVEAALDRLAAHPAVAVVCGNSEVEQQAAMLGLPRDAGAQPFYGEELRERLDGAACDAVHVPSAPTGGDRPFRTDVGIANYYGVGGYRRPLSDVRLARVRFAAESLAFANVPDDEALDPATWPADRGGSLDTGTPIVGSAAWKALVPRDNGSSWDFEDVRDHYLAELYGVDPDELRRTDPARYLELGRLVTGEVMGEVFGEWRRSGSGCGGGLVLWLRDVRPGTGWGVLDHRGLPKAAWHHLRRALAPVAVWLTDEGLNGMQVHVANDEPTALETTLRVSCYRDGETLVDEAATPIRVEPASVAARDVEDLLGHFADVGWAYRFGPPSTSVVVATLAGDDETRPRSQAFRFPLGRPAEAVPTERLGLRGEIRALADGSPAVSLRADRYVHGVRIHVPGWVAEDEVFGLEPGRDRSIALTGDGSGRPPAAGVVMAANLRGRVTLTASPGGAS